MQMLGYQDQQTLDLLFTNVVTLNIYIIEKRYLSGVTLAL